MSEPDTSKSIIQIGSEETTVLHTYNESDVSGLIKVVCLMNLFKVERHLK